MGRIPKKKKIQEFVKCQGDKQKKEEELYQNKILYFIVSEANACRYFAKYLTLETLDKTLSLNKNQTNKKNPIRLTKKYNFLKPIETPQPDQQIYGQ